MSFGTKIQYAHATFSPWLGCSKTSIGCQSCFAERWAKRSGMVEWGPGKPRRRTSESYWKQPLKWNKQAEKEGTRYRVLTDLCDPFDEEVTWEWKYDFHYLIRDTPNLTWLVLTKRPVEADRFYKELTISPSNNLWLGATVCNQSEADRDIPILLSIPAAKHWLSIEPMLGPVDLFEVGGIMAKGLNGLDWIVCGGESGGGARPMHPAWARSVRDQCQAAGIPYYFKQWGEWIPWEFDDQQFNNVAYSQHKKELWNDDVPRDPLNLPKGWETFFMDDPIDLTLFQRVGTKAAGNLLDGQKWEHLPE